MLETPYRPIANDDPGWLRTTLKLFSTRPTDERRFYVLSSSWKVVGQNFNMFLQFQKIETD